MLNTDSQGPVAPRDVEFNVDPSDPPPPAQVIPGWLAGQKRDRQRGEKLVPGLGVRGKRPQGRRSRRKEKDAMM